MFLLAVLGKHPFPCHFQLPGFTCVPWLRAPFSIFKVSGVTFFYLCFWHDLHSLTLLPSFNQPCDYIGPTQITKNNFSFSLSLITSGWSFLSGSSCIHRGALWWWRGSEEQVFCLGHREAVQSARPCVAWRLKYLKEDYGLEQGMREVRAGGGYPGTSSLP